MQQIFIDYETYYDTEYSLRKMTPIEYVLDPRFECFGAAIKYGIRGVSYWIDGPDLPAFFAGLDPKNVMLISHNALFDAIITSFIYNFVPRITADTLGIARAILGSRMRSVSLEKVAGYLLIGVKGKALLKTIGMHAADIKAAGLWDEFVSYALNDDDLCAGIFEKLVVFGEFPIDELAVMDMIIRCVTQPKFRIDSNAILTHLNQVTADKNILLTRAMLAGADGKSDLMSNDKFAELLMQAGVDPPTKISPSTGKTTWAFAKSDAAFIELEEHPSPAVQALVAARLGHKSTLAETRATRLHAISQLRWPHGQSSVLPMPLRFSGAHTHRFSGDWSLNVQNLPTRNGNELRRALTCGPDEDVVTVDSSQIQARLVATLCKQLDLIDAFARGEDVYASFASIVFQKPVNKKEQPLERFIGKTGILGLGFGLGWIKFQRQLHIDALNQMGIDVSLSDEDAQGVVTTYRTKYSQIPKGWKALNYEGIPVLAFGGSFEFGPLKFEKGAIYLPGHLKMHYDDLTQDSNGDWYYNYAGFRRKTYGGSLLENIAQYLERIIVTDAAVRIQRRVAQLNVRLQLHSHDELVYICHKKVTPVLKDLIHHEMCRRPEWMPDLPLAAEEGSGASYGDAK